MRLALVIFNADPRRGGAEKYTADIAAALAGRGHEVDLLAGNFGSGIPGVCFVPLSADGIMRSARYLSFLDALDKHLRDRPYDRVHAMLPVRRCDIYHPHAGMAKAALLTHRGRDSSASRAASAVANRLNRKRRRYAQVEAQMLKSSPRPLVICLSDYVKQATVRLYPDIAPQLVKLFNAVDLKAFDPCTHEEGGAAVRRQFQIERDAPLGLIVAQHFDRKGLPQIVQAIAKLRGAQRDHSMRLLVVGHDDPVSSARLAEDLGVRGQIIFAGTTDHVADFYAAADFFVLPTRHDSCSLATLEALAMGVPVISTVYNGACEIMTDGKHGFVLPDPDDVAALAAAMQQLADPTKCSEMSFACRQLRPLLSFENHVHRLEEIYSLPRLEE